MAELILQAKAREAGKKSTKDLRSESLIPAIVYRRGVENKNISILAKDFKKIYEQASESTIIFLEINGEKIPVLIYDQQIDPLTQNVLHVDFYQIKMDEKVETEVTLLFVGEAPAVKELGGTLEKDISTISISCLPADLVNEIKVDISVLKTFDMYIRVKDLILPAGIVAINDQNDVVATVVPPMTEEEITGSKAEMKVEDVKVSTEKGKIEEKAGEQLASVKTGTKKS